MEKAKLRKEYIAKMAALTNGELEDRSQAIAKLFFENFKLMNEHIHVFLSIARNNEINTFHIINQILRQFPKVKIAVPKSDFTTGAITNYSYSAHTRLKVNKLGIPEPVSGEIIDPSQFDIVLVPLLCFDKEGYRVGYGKGFYDRFLPNCKPGVKKIGLSLFPPIEKISDTNDFDVKMDGCIEPGGLTLFYLS